MAATPITTPMAACMRTCPASLSERRVVEGYRPPAPATIPETPKPSRKQATLLGYFTLHGAARIGGGSIRGTPALYERELLEIPPVHLAGVHGVFLVHAH